MFDGVKDVKLSSTEVTVQSEMDLHRVGVGVLGYSRFFFFKLHHRIVCAVTLNCSTWRASDMFCCELFVCVSPGGNEEDISLFSMQRSAAAKEDGRTKALNNILNMDCSGRVSP